MANKPPHFTYCLLAVALLFLSADHSYAQQTDDSLKVELDSIEVTAIHSTVSAADAPLALSIYSRDLDTINQEASLSLQSISQQMPGLWVNDRQNYALGERLTIRGIGWRAAFGVRGIQVVLNDMPLTVADGQTMINIVDPAFIRRAELVRGPAATYWGNSSGGVLYLSTRPDYDENSSIRLRTMAGSYSMRKIEGEFSISNPSHKMSGYSSYLTTDGYRDYSAAKVMRSGVTGSVNLSSKSQLKYQAASIYMPDANHPSALTAPVARQHPRRAVSSYVQAGAGKQLTQTQAGLSYIRQTPAGILNVTGYGIHRDLSNPLPFAIITINRWAGGLRASLDKSWSNLELQAGLEAKLQNDDRTEFENQGSARRGAVTVNQIERVWNQAAFATATYSAGNFNILGGLRYDRLTFRTDNPVDSLSGSRTFQSVSPSLGINYQPGSQTIFANLSTSFEAPTTTELVNRPGGGNGFNPNLKPEHTIGLETGIRGTIGNQALRYDLTGYHLWIQDLLFPYQLQANGPTYYQNQGETRHLGLEGRLALRINRNWQLSTTGSITQAEFQQAQTVDSVSLSGKQVPGIPKYRLNADLNWSPANFLGSISYKYVSSYYANNLNTAKNKAYGIVDAKFSWQKMFTKTGISIQPFINVNNLLDSRYNSSVTVNAYGGRYFEPAPGRNWQAGVSVDF